MLDDLIETVQLTDYEVRTVMRNAAREADRVLKRLGPTATVRRMQIELAKVNAEAWASVGSAVKVGIGDAFDATATWMARYDYDLMRSIGMSSSHWQQSMLATSRTGLESYLARKQNGITLSEQVWRSKAISGGMLDKTINNALILGKSQRELAKDVIGFLNPNVAGGASYAAMRLGRTEVANAYHASSIQRYKESPWVERAKWNLSGSHKKPDECNEYAETVQHRGWGQGEFLPSEVPGKPHPQCLCFVTPVAMDLDQYAKNFADGKYDDYINQQMGCYHG
jgi:hypothetical protein